MRSIQQNQPAPIGVPYQAPPGAPPPGAQGQYAPPGGQGQYAPPGAPPPGGQGQYAPPGAPPPGGQGQYAPPGAPPPGGQGQYAPPGAPPPGGQGQYAPPGAPPPGGQGQYAPPPQQGYDQPPQQFGTMRTNNSDVLSRHLRGIINNNGIQSFYPEPVLNNLIGKLSQIDFQRLSSSWNIPKEIAYDLSSLSLYDVIFYCDDSGSMRIEENGERIEDLKLILQRVAEFAVALDDDGVSVRFMNSNITGDHLKTPNEINALIDRVNFNGLTPLGSQLQRRVIEPMILAQAQQRTLQKPILVIVITDGEPVGEDRNATRNIIIDTKQRMTSMGYGEKAVAFTFVQCGKDMGAQRFLGELDKDPIVGRMIDCVSYYELESEEYARKGVNLTPELFLVKLCIGAIDAAYDEGDE
ncbi:hypothetical protein HDU97_000230 [Phlyctochytrium planicorne]|nr:hypothetical protein HDU97_000230 [Phlyctochytrium planicorne]